MLSLKKKKTKSVYLVFSIIEKIKEENIKIISIAISRWLNYRFSFVPFYNVQNEQIYTKKVM